MHLSRFAHPARTAPHEPFPAIGAAHSTNEPCRGSSHSDRGPRGGSGHNRLPPQTRRSARRRRVPMLYGTRRGSRPALLPRVSGVTWEYVTPDGALDERREPHHGDSVLRATRPDDGRETDHRYLCSAPDGRSRQVGSRTETTTYATRGAMLSP